MDDEFSHLCQLLDEELECQENVLALLDAQNQALSERDVTLLQTRTAALAAVAAESSDIAVRRARAVEGLGRRCGVARNPTLRALEAAAPEPWRSRLQWYRQRLRAVVNSVQLAGRGNGILARTALRSFEGALKELGLQNAPEGYTGAGRQYAAAAGPGLIDERG